MHLTNRESGGSDSRAAPGRPDGAVAPEQEIEVTPEMIEAGVLELREKCIGEDLAEVVTDVFYVMLAAREGGGGCP